MAQEQILAPGGSPEAGRAHREVKGSLAAAILDFCVRTLIPRRRLRITREGWVFASITLSIGVVAVNTGHNLFYLIFALLLSTMVVSGILSERVLKGIEVRRRLPDDIAARVPFAVVLEVHNPHPRRFAYSLSVTDAGGFLPPRRPLAFVPCLGPRETRHLHYLAELPRRGEHLLGPLYLSTRFPFGLFEKVRIIRQEQTLIVYPAPRVAPRPDASASGDEQPTRKKRRSGEELWGLRAASPEDDQRLIHWRTSARMGQLMAKEFAESRQYPRHLFFDNQGEQGERFEQAVESAAALLFELMDRGSAVTFATWEGHFHPAAGIDERRRTLRHLALITPLGGARGRGFDAWRATTLKEGGGIFLGSGGPLPTLLPPCEVVTL